MEFDQALEQTHSLALSRQDYTLSTVDTLILNGTWSGLTYDEMANNSDYSLNYLMRDVAPRLWKLLSKVYGERVSKSNYRAVCDRYADTAPETSSAPSVPSPTCPSNPLAAVLDKPDWGDAPDVPDSGFFGRVDELKQLQDWLLDEHKRDRCRLVTLWGLPGIGKTSLARRLADQVKHDFEFVIWRSLHNKPLLKDLARDVLPRLGVSVVPGQEIAQFIEVFGRSRCLLILDGLESLLRNNDPWRRYEPDYANYGTLFQRLAEIPHQSCLLLTGQEKPRELNLLEYPSQPVRLQEVKGLDSSAAIPFAQAYGLQDQTEWSQLFERFGGHPLILKEIAILVRDTFSGQLGILRNLSLMLSKSNLNTIQKLNTVCRDLTEKQKLVLSILSEKTASITVLLEKSELDLGELIPILEELKVRSLIGSKVEQQEDTSQKILFQINQVLKFSRRRLDEFNIL